MFLSVYTVCVLTNVYSFFIMILKISLLFDASACIQILYQI
jgi:hypothetical protein